jgi:hypothetical protein
VIVCLCVYVFGPGRGLDAPGFSPGSSVSAAAGADGAKVTPGQPSVSTSTALRSMTDQVVVFFSNWVILLGNGYTITQRGGLGSSTQRGMVRTREKKEKKKKKKDAPDAAAPSRPRGALRDAYGDWPVPRIDLQPRVEKIPQQQMVQPQQLVLGDRSWARVLRRKIFKKKGFYK